MSSYYTDYDSNMEDEYLDELNYPHETKLTSKLISKIDNYTTMFSNIDPSVVKQIVVNFDGFNEEDLLETLFDISKTATTTKTEDEIIDEIGYEAYSEMKFNSTGMPIQVEEGSSTKKEKKLKRTKTVFKHLDIPKNVKYTSL